MNTAEYTSDTSTVEYDVSTYHDDTMSEGETVAAGAPDIAPLDNPPTIGGAEATSGGDGSAMTAGDAGVTAGDGAWEATVTSGTEHTASSSTVSSAAIEIPAAIVHHVTTGVAAGDGDLMPALFAGDQRSNAGEWARDFSDYIAMRHIPDETARILLRNRLTGVARQWHERLPLDLSLSEVLHPFRERFGDSESTRDRLTAEF